MVKKISSAFIQILSFCFSVLKRSLLKNREACSQKVFQNLAGTTILILFIPLHSIHSQVIIRKTLSSVGGWGASNDFIFQQSVGQPSVTTTVFGDTYRLGQGFLQPLSRFEKSQSKLTYSIFPNPNQGDFNVIVNLPAGEKASLNLFDCNGKRVNKIVADGSSKIPVSISKLPSGVYFLEIETLMQIVTEKIVVLN